MKIEVEVVWFGAGLKARLYSVRLPGQADAETTRFFNRMLIDARYKLDERFGTALRKLLDWLDRITRLEGALLRLFRTGEGYGQALPIDNRAIAPNAHLAILAVELEKIAFDSSICSHFLPRWLLESHSTRPRDYFIENQ